MPVNRLALRKWITEVIRREGYKAGEINYIFCSSDYHRQMNRDFLGHDYYTDVITFEDRESRVVDGIVAGEVYIDVATVEDNADIYGALPFNEMRRLENRYLKLLREEIL